MSMISKHENKDLEYSINSIHRAKNIDLERAPILNLWLERYFHSSSMTVSIGYIFISC